MLNLLLAFAGGVLGLAAAGGAAYAFWLIAIHRRPPESEKSQMQTPYPAALLRWTWLDYIVLGVSLFGFLLLLADVVAVMRDRDSYPGYHYPYLICGVLLAFMGMLIGLLRLLMLVHAIREARNDKTH